MKDELNEIWEQEDEQQAEALLMDWILYAESTGIRVLHQFARTLRMHALGILAWYDYPISTGTMAEDALKGVRYLLLKRSENLDPARHEPERLAEALRLNEPVMEDSEREDGERDCARAALRSSGSSPTPRPCFPAR